MRRIFVLTILFSCVAVSSSMAAEDDVAKAAVPLITSPKDPYESLLGDRFTLKAGYKVWVAKWQAQVSTGGLSNQANTDHPSAMHGPTVTGIVKLRESDWFNAAVVNFTWLYAGFDFAEQSDTGNHFYANRRDYSITAGLAIWQGFGVFAGYYNSHQEFTNQPNAPGFPVDRHPRSLNGPIFGVFGNVPASEYVSLYGNLAFALLNFEGRGNIDPNLVQNTNSAQGYMVEVGVTLHGPRVWKIGTELQAGFRAQMVQKNFGANATGGAPPNGTNQLPLQDLTYGPIVSVSATF